MADNPPISTSIPETVTVDTGADPQSIESLKADFADFWKEQDQKEGETPAAEVAPAAPGEGTAQETRPAKPEPKPVPVEAKPPISEPKPQISEPKPREKELTDDDIDRIEMTPHARPEVVEDFKKVKDLWKSDRARMRAEIERAVKLEQDLALARQNAWTPEQKADYEHAAQVRRRFDYVSDPEFISKFQAPIAEQYREILQDAIGMLSDPVEAQAWAQSMLDKWSPDQLTREWWNQSVLAKVPDELRRSELKDSITQLLKLQRERDAEISRRTGDKSAFDNWITEKSQHTAQRVQEEIMAETHEQEKRIAEYLPRNIDEAKTTEERKAIEAHNERFNTLNTYFNNTMQDLSHHGPRAWVRASLEATRALILEQNYNALESDYKSVIAERDRYKAELDKIAGARRKLSQTTGTPPTSTLKKDGQTLSVKDLDVRKSFEAYDWGDSK